MTPPDPARLFVLLASEADYAIILRRGPTKQVCTVGWNLENDTFQLGQWLMGRIYEDTCDIPPNGKHWIYEAFKYDKDRGRFSYSVLAQAPYLKSIKWWKGSPIRAAFFAPDGLYISSLDWNNQKTALEVSTLRKLDQLPVGIAAGISGDLSRWKLQRNGWTLAENSQSSIEPWIKSLHEWELACSLKRDRWLTTQTYNVRHLTSGVSLDCTNWQWAEIRTERLLWAKGGKIFAAQLQSGGHGPIRELVDLNAWQFEPAIAPY